MKKISEPMVGIPYLWSDGYDIEIDGTLHTLYVYTQPKNTWGIRSWYENEEGRRVSSPLVTYDVNTREVTIHDESKIADLDTESESMPTEYYTLTGVRIPAPIKGVPLIKRTGSKAEKILL